MKKFKTLAIILVLFCVQSGFSQDEEKPDESLKEAQKKDKTGTNPINFTYDVRLVTEMQQLKNGGGSFHKNYIEFRAPLGRDLANIKGQEAGGFLFDLGNRWALRFRGYYNTVNFNDAANTTVSGIGDFDARILTVAYASSKFAIAPGIEGFFNTASNDVIGSGSNIVAPVIFFAWFNALGKYSIIAPGIQHRASIGGKKVSNTALDIYYVKILSKGKNWLVINPQPVYDWENEVEFMTVDVEWGFMIAKVAGLSGYLRPGLGVGADRPFNYNFEYAIKFVWN